MHAQRRARSLVVPRPRPRWTLRHAARIHRQAGNMTVTFDPEVTAEEFRGRRVAIIGLGKGRTTAGLARFLVRQGANVTIADPHPREDRVVGNARRGVLAEQVTLILGPVTHAPALTVT